MRQVRLDGPTTEVITAGAAVRTWLRAQLRSCDGITFEEERGFFKSYFIVHVPADWYFTYTWED